MAGGGEGGVTGVAVTVWTTSAWRALLERSTYHIRATHVLVGPRVWLQDWLDVVCMYIGGGNGGGCGVELWYF